MYTAYHHAWALPRITQVFVTVLFKKGNLIVLTNTFGWTEQLFTYIIWCKEDFVRKVA